MSDEAKPPPRGGLQYMQSEAQALKNSVGTEVNWGWSPAFDLLEHLPQHQLDGDLEEPINVLLDSPGDVRHILCTLSRVKRHTERPVHFYVYEPNLKHFARHLFFLTWFFDQTDVSALDESAAEFFELYGNTMLRDSGKSSLKRYAKKAANLARGGRDVLEERIDMEGFIKMKEVDWISEQLDAWGADKATFNVDYQWDGRVRADIGDRYDSKNNVMDWDFTMGLVPYTAHIRWPEYKDWRATGVAYDWGRVNPKRQVKYEYLHPNKSLAIFPDRKRTTGVYNGDVRCGPWTCFGIDSEWPDLTVKTHDNTFKYSNGVVALHNIRAWLYERLTGYPWQWSEFKLAWDAPEYKQEQKVKSIPAPPPPPDFKFVACGIDQQRVHLLLKTKRAEPVLFDVMYFSCQAAQNLTPERTALLKPKGYAVVETVKFCVYMELPQKDTYVQKVNELAEAAGLQPAESLTKRLHRFNPVWKLPFSRNPDAKLTEAQEKEKRKHDSPWGLAFTKKEVS